MWEVNEGEAGPVFFFDPFGAFSDPDGGFDVGAGAPEVAEGKGAEVFFDAIPQGHRVSVDVEDFAAIGRVERARGDGDVRCGVHVEPPEELGAGELGIDTAEGLPEFFAVHELLGLFPEAVLGVVAVIPAVGDDAVIAGESAGEVGGLRRAGDGGEDGLDESGAVALDEGTDGRGVLADEPGGEADDVEDGGALHISQLQV